MIQRLCFELTVMKEMGTDQPLWPMSARSEKKHKLRDFFNLAKNPRKIMIRHDCDVKSPRNTNTIGQNNLSLDSHERFERDLTSKPIRSLQTAQKQYLRQYIDLGMECEQFDRRYSKGSLIFAHLKFFKQISFRIYNCQSVHLVWRLREG
jgi:hypothetical protein